MSVAEQLAEVRARIDAACRASARAPSEVTLVAVSKSVAITACAEALAAGQAELGENYAQELRKKAAALPGARWHFIGDLQRNKVKYVVGVAELIHSVDRVELVEEIARRAAQLDRVQRCLIQVNVAGEPQKAGCTPTEVGVLVAACARHASLSCEGLMCIPPEGADPTPHFEALSQLGRALCLRQLSMGMSADFERAIASGATLVRVGTAIFGARPPHTRREPA